MRANPRSGDLDFLLRDASSLEGLDALLLLRPSGTAVAEWMRPQIRKEVLCVMSATMLASVDALLEELQGRQAAEVLVEADNRRFVVLRTHDGNLLVALASHKVPKRRLVSTARDLVTRLARAPPPEEAAPAVLPAD